ncbi:MoaD/ThiS family protein [Archaeoglobus sp.]
MRVKVQLFETLRRFGKEFEVEGNSLEEVLRKLASKLGKDFYMEVFDENGSIRSDRIITVDGRNVKDERPKLKDGSVIAIFPPIAGG